MNKLSNKGLWFAIITAMCFSCSKQKEQFDIIDIPQEVKGVIDTTAVNAYDISLLYGDWKLVKYYADEYFDGELVRTEDINSQSVGNYILSLHSDGTTNTSLWIYKYNFLIMMYPKDNPEVYDCTEVIGVDEERLVCKLEALPESETDPSSGDITFEFEPFYKNKSGRHLFCVKEYERLTSTPYGYFPE